ncbi:MAG: PotD/PotF family extracellular solute-binding protein [Lachnospiraceae bacterium]
MKKWLKKAVAITGSAVLLGASLTACGSGGSDSASGDNGTLNIFVWTEYVPESVVSAFEEETGIKVNMTTFSSNEDMLAKLKSESEGTYDIVQPSDYMVEQLIAQDMLEKVDTEALTNLDNIGEAYRNPSYDPTGEYSVPYLGGVGAIAVNTDKITDEITSYDDLFKSEYANSLVVLDDFRATIGMTERSMGLSMNETDPDTLAEVKDKLLTLKNNIKLYDSDSPKSALISGDCVLGFCWSAEIALAMEENPAIEVVYPSEGAFLFLDNWCIPTGTKNYDNANKFINYMLEAETAKAVGEEFPYLNPNTAAVELLGSDFSDNPAKNPPAEVIANGEFVQNVDTDTIKILDDMWTELKK